MKVAELMQTNLQTISADATIADAVETLTGAQVSALPVIDRFGRAVGIISAREILKAESECDSPVVREHLFERTRVLEVMTAWPTTIDPDLDIRQAAQEMLYLNVQRLFVEFEGALVGVISQTDIVGAVATSKV
jgi:acetoin utilization protein AcuB